MIGFAQQMKRPVDVSRSQRAEPRKIGFAQQMKRPVDGSREEQTELWANRYFAPACLRAGKVDRCERGKPPSRSPRSEGPAPQTPRGIFEAKRAWEVRA